MSRSSVIPLEAAFVAVKVLAVNPSPLLKSFSNGDFPDIEVKVNLNLIVNPIEIIYV